MDNTEQDFTRLPGLYRSWDLGILIEEGRIYRVEDSGRTEDGQALFAVFTLDIAECVPGSEA